MKVRVGAISDRLGATMDVDLEQPCPKEILDIGQCPEPIRLSGQLTNTGDSLVFKGSIEAKLQFECTRCLEPFIFEAHVPVEEEFRRGKGASDPREAAEEELFGDVNYYQGDVIEFDDVIRDNLMVNIPVSRVCNEECRGLCPVCGRNRLLDPCDCNLESIDPRLEDLSKLLK